MKRRGFLQKLGLGVLAAPFVARLEVAEAAEPEPTHEYAEGLLGQLQRARDEYEDQAGLEGHYFFASRATMTEMWKELGHDLPRDGGLTVIRVESMGWIQGHNLTPRSEIDVNVLFIVVNEPPTLRYEHYDSRFNVTDHEQHMALHRSLLRKMDARRRGRITGVTSE